MAILALHDVSPRDLPRIGGKAAGLVRLADKGLPVPAAVVVTTDAFEAFLRHNGLQDDARRGHPELAARVLGGALDPDFAGQLRAAVARLGPRLAVRSSAPDEDGHEASFAGQYETVLGVAPGDETERALLRCWASAYGERALAYRRGRGGVGMAVVIQALVEARCAGVMFTINPLSGSWREMTVEAAWGLGEAVVAGRVVPDFYRVRRPRRAPRPVQRVLARVRLDVVEDLVRRQEVQWSGPDAPVPVPRARVDAPKLRQAEILRLCRLGLRIEGLLGGPQDVEWAQDEQGRFFVLQARPVTAGADVRRSGPEVYTRRFIGERWTEPATPLGWSLMRELLDWFIAYPATSRRLLGGGPATRLHRMAPYMNATVFRHLAFKLPGAAPPRFLLELLPPSEERGWLRRRAEAPGLRVYRSILAETLAEKRWQRFRWNPFTNWRAWEQVRARLDDELPALQAPIEGRREAAERAARCAELARVYVGTHICSLLFANIWYESSLAALEARDLLPLAHAVLRPPEQTWTERTNHALWRLGRGELDLETFLADFGHRSGSSWALFSPRWVEDPEHVRTLARAMIDRPDPMLTAVEQTLRAERALKQVPVSLSWMVGLTRRYLQLREDQRWHFDHLLWSWKRCYLWLEDDLDLQIRFLEQGELDRLLAGELSRERAEELVERRRRAWVEEGERRARGDEPPAFLVGDEGIEDASDGLRLQGHGISPGVVTGPVRVLRSLSEAHKLRPGEILVTRATDPGWTPLFLTASGLVMELGGMLSHGAVIAREYGLPGVVNIGGATHRLVDGQTVTVDGSRGVVWVR